METGSTGHTDKVPIPKRLQKWRTCSRSNAEDVIGVTSTSKREISWKLTIASLVPLAERMGMAISNYCIAIAMIRKRPPTVRRRPEVLLTSQTIEEPDDANVSRPVLKPSGRGDPVA